mgnify:CR=1 FL=1
MRLFVGIALPASIRERLLILMGGLKGARWRRDDQLHITLRFLGEVDGATAEDLDEALAAIRMAPFTIRLKGMGLFGSLGDPRILWTGTEPEEELRRLQEKVERRVTDLGLVAEGRKFSPHVTLARFGGARFGGIRSARVGRRRNPDKIVSGLGEFVKAHADFETPDFEVSDFALYSSVLGSGGATYRIEVDYPLGTSST